MVLMNTGSLIFVYDDELNAAAIVCCELWPLPPPLRFRDDITGRFQGCGRILLLSCFFLPPSAGYLTDDLNLCREDGPIGVIGRGVVPRSLPRQRASGAFAPHDHI